MVKLKARREKSMLTFQQLYFLVYQDLINLQNRKQIEIIN
uniref:Uncharacterized protein n=1 Tax=Anguilla anguilla TaxID=7936 RepID=A0A0E9SIN3_ANGAN